MKKRRHGPQTRPRSRLTVVKARLGNDKLRAGLCITVKVDEPDEVGRGRPAGWAMHDARPPDLMQTLTKKGLEAKWFRFMCARQEFSGWTMEDRELFVESNAGRTFEPPEAALLVHSLAECLQTKRGTVDKLILTGSSLMLACRIHSMNVNQALETVASWKNAAKKPSAEEVEPSPEYKALLVDLERLTRMSKPEIVERCWRLKLKVLPALARWRMITSAEGHVAAHGLRVDPRNPALRDLLGSRVMEDRRLKRIPPTILHPNDVAIAISELPPATPIRVKVLLVPYVRCVAPGCHLYLDAAFFRHTPAQDKGGPPMTVCTIHSMRYWTLIERHYPGGILGLLQGREPDGFDLAACWDEEIKEDDIARVRPAHNRIVKVGEGRGVVIHDPELTLAEGGIWWELHRRFGGRFDGVSYRIPVPEGDDIVVKGEVIGELGNAIIIRHGPETLPLRVSNEPMLTWQM